MKILLINPSIPKFNSDFFSKINNYLCKIIFSDPLTFRMIDAVTPKNYSVKFIDERHQRIEYNEEYDLVGISSVTPAAPRAYEIADKFRAKGIPVILGGWHPSALPDEAIKHADSVVIGEAEESWPQLLKDFEKDKLKSFYEKQVDLNKIPTACNDINQSGKFSFIGEIQATRGCSIGCKYCCVSNSKYVRKFRNRSIENIIKEISSVPSKYFLFHDPSFTLDPKFTKQLFQEMKQLNKKFSCNGNVRILNRDEELLKLASEAGCVEWAIGFESISQESLDEAGKYINKIEDYTSTIDKIHDYGMVIKGNFMFGFDGDHLDIFDKTIDAIKDLGIDLPAFSILTPFPGTPLFDNLEKEKRIITRDWSKYDTLHVVFQPKHMSSQELFDEATRVRKTVNSVHNSIKRATKCLKFGPLPFLTTGISNFFY